LAITSFGDKGNLRGLANKLVLFRVGLGRHQCQVRGAVRRSDRYPAPAGLKTGIKDQVEDLRRIAGFGPNRERRW